MKAFIIKYGIKILVIIAIIAAVIAGINYVQRLQQEVKIAEQNRLATVELYESEKNTTYALNVKLEDLNRYKNAQIQEMDSIRNVLKIKDKQLKAMYGQKSSADMRDTIRIPVFIPSEDSTVYTLDSIRVDTCVGDPKWYNVCISRVDSTSVAVSAHFESDLTIITAEKKVPVNKPRKTWLGRLFQKKTKTMTITAIEQNPFVTKDSTIYVIPIK